MNVSVTDRNGRLIDRKRVGGGRRYSAGREEIGRVKAEFMLTYGPDCYTFVNEDYGSIKD
jgi:hypothetical protein